MLKIPHLYLMFCVKCLTAKDGLVLPVLLYKNSGTESPGGGAGQMGAEEQSCFWGSPALCLGSKEGAQEKCGVECSFWSFFLQQPALESEL